LLPPKEWLFGNEIRGIAERQYPFSV